MKTKTYRLEDGGSITATSPEAFVMTLRKSSRFDSDCTNEEYMHNFAERYRVQTGKTIKVDDATTFLCELERIGFITESE